MLKSWSVFGSVFALSVACGVSCSDNASDGSAAGTDAGAAGANADASGSAAGANAGAAGSAAPDGGTGGAEFFDCTPLSAAACAADDRCSLLTASPVYPGCSRTEQPIACTALTGCGQLATRARDPEGREWIFDDTCLPDGWQPLPWTAACGSGDAGAGGSGPSSGCSSLGIATCTTAPGCVVLRARLLSSPPGSPDEPVGCVDDGACRDVNITARDPQGRDWAFPDTCIPDGWIGEGGAGNQ